jgi:hypothetical protein
MDRTGLTGFFLVSRLSLDTRKSPLLVLWNEKIMETEMRRNEIINEVGKLLRFDLMLEEKDPVLYGDLVRFGNDLCNASSRGGAVYYTLKAGERELRSLRNRVNSLVSAPVR